MWLNKLAKFDYEETGMDAIDYAVERDVLFFWVWIKWRVWRDKDKKAPIARRFSPQSAIIDPNAYITWHRYLWFEVMEDIDKLQYDSSFFNLNKVESGNNASSDLEQDLDAYTETRYLSQDYSEWNVSSPMFDAYHHFICFNGKKYLTTRANDRSTMIRCLEIESSWSYEKENPYNVDYPVVLKYFKPWNMIVSEYLYQISLRTMMKRYNYSRTYKSRSPIRCLLR